MYAAFFLTLLSLSLLLLLLLLPLARVTTNKKKPTCSSLERWTIR